MFSTFACEHLLAYPQETAYGNDRANAGTGKAVADASRLEQQTATGFARRLREGPLALALEITPPKTMLPAVLARRAALLGHSSHAVNVIQRPDRLSSLDACIALREMGVEPVWHLVCRGRTHGEIAGELERACEAGIDQVLCILGDHVATDAVKSPSVREVVALARETLPGALIGATFNQYAPDQDKAILNLRRKCEAGASYVQTQPSFDPVAFADTAAALGKELGHVALVPMVMPLLTIEAVDRIEERLRIEVPVNLRDVVATGTEAAWVAFESIVSGLLATGAVQGLAVMTFEMDPPPGTGERIVGALHIRE